jgi:hypothetical protein
MIELWFYSGRIGNCMFAYAVNRCVADTLKLQCTLPKGTEITGFPLISEDSINAKSHEDKYIIYGDYQSNPKTLINENDNMSWFIEKQFQGSKINSYDECVTINKILSTPDIQKKWIVTLGNFEIGEQYLPYRDKLKQWFTFPEINYNKFEFFKIHPDLGLPNYYVHVPFNGIKDNDLLISLRLEDYTSNENLDRFLGYDYFKIILESKKWDNVYILTNPGSIGHNSQYDYIKPFYGYDPILVRCYNPVMSMGFGSMFKNIAISQSTYSWWLSFLSNAENIFYPIPKIGPFSFVDTKYISTDLRISSKEFKYVDYQSGVILDDDYYSKIDYKNKKWID